MTLSVDDYGVLAEEIRFVANLDSPRLVEASFRARAREKFALSRSKIRPARRKHFLIEGKQTMQTISRDELKRKIDLKHDFFLVETLPEAAYHHAHLPGALNLPPDQVNKLAPQLLPDKDALIVVYCANPT